jgi:hypothetical protein
VALLGTALILGGCYGSTEPATDIGFDHATFNGKGTTNDGPARVYFEYWPTGHPKRKLPSLGDDLPAGVTGPVSQPNFPVPLGLYADTDYSFRLCATDRGSPNGLCAQTRTFRTKKPAGDFVEGGVLTHVGGQGHDGGVSAQSGPSGANPTGNLRLPDDANANTFSGNVSCLAVHGNEAVIGAVGARADGTPASGLMKVRDDLEGEHDGVSWTITDNGSAPDCANATIGTLGSYVLTVFTVYDTP